MTQLPPHVLKMLREHVEIHGDPFSPWASSTNYADQTKEHRCAGCDAAGHSKWPDWKVELDHKPGCAWLAWDAIIRGNDA